MDDYLPPELLEASLAEMPTTTASVTDAVTEDGSAIFLKTARCDIFHDYRDPRNLMLRGVSFSWEMPNANSYDYYRSGTGWMVFLEADLRAVTVRIRHDNPIDEPSPTLLGRTFSIFADRDPNHYGQLMRTITRNIDSGQSPLWAIAMTESYFPKFIKDALVEPFDDGVEQAFITPFGFCLAGDIKKVFRAMKIDASFYGDRE